MSTRGEALLQGRESYRAQAWGDAFSQLSAADRESPLDPEDLLRLATAAHLIGKEADGVGILARAHQRFANAGDPCQAARCAFWLALGLTLNGEFAQSGGWLSRARRLLEDHAECVEQGYLLLPVAIQAAMRGDTGPAYGNFVQVAAIARQFADTDLATFALMGQGRVLIQRGETEIGLSLLDEAMIAVTAGEVSPMVAGGVYCAVIEACSEIFDLRRAHEWTSALERWCGSQPDAIPYRGHCLLRRAEMLQLQGDWSGALDQALQARERFSQPPTPGLGAALYRMAEIHRLRGEFVEAEESYLLAGGRERIPRPGMAQLRLAQGRIDSAYAAIRQVVEEVRQPGIRAHALETLVEIALAANDVRAARAAADELSEIAGRLQAPFLKAVAARADGQVLLAERDVRGALAALRLSLSMWLEIEAPYESARVRLLIALACRKQGDDLTANVELDAARAVFEQLGAVPDVARVEALSQQAGCSPNGPLTAREVQVLRLVAEGMTNRAIAHRLRISEKTVARHVSNIFTKLDLSSRAAAAAYAFRSGVVGAAST